MRCVREREEGPTQPDHTTLLYSTLSQSGLVAKLLNFHRMEEAVEDGELVGIGSGDRGGRCSRRSAANNLNLYGPRKGALTPFIP